MPHQSLPFQPVVIIGAGRSGTNALRDALCLLPSVATWPCDEINPIMRHGNIAMAHDRFGAAQATKPVSNFIRGAFVREWKHQNKPSFLIEKTCANSLRVPFLREILPEAKFIFLHRHGGDVLASAQKRWRGELELPSLPYYWSKVRFTPLRDLPIYAWRFVKARWRLFRGKQAHLSSWGPISPEMLNLPPDTSLEHICAQQWADCVGFALDDLAQLEAEKVIHIGYEKFVTEPQPTLLQLAKFLGHDASEAQCRAASHNVRASSIGKGAETMLTLEAPVASILHPALRRLGYEEDR
jgi:hypothetical protein